MKYEMFKMKIEIEKEIHISCVEQTLKQIKELGEVKGVIMEYFIDDKLRYGGIIEQDDI